MMTRLTQTTLLAGLFVIASASCKEQGTSEKTGNATVSSTVTAAPTPSPDPVVPDGPKNIVHVALSSKDHTTLVKALKSADYVDSLTNPGPFTVFAPTNEAFAKLPPGALDDLLKPEKRDDLKTVLKQHVAVSVYQVKDFKDGQTLGMANGGKVTFHVKDGKVRIGDANIVASVPATNGIVHVIDGVLLPAK